jgi:DNA-binding GntR family transcriptional regulator
MTAKMSSVNEHDQLIRALADRDPATAAAVMKQNWLRPMDEVYQALEQDGPPSPGERERGR